MTVQSTPFALQNAAHPAAVFRQAMSAPYSIGGYVGAGELLVGAQQTPNMAVTLGPGRAKVVGTNVASAGTTSGFTTQAMYDVLNDANVSLTIAAADPTNPRIDAVYVGVQDSYYSGTNNTALAGVVTGTPAPTPTVPSVPSNSLLVAKIAVAANATSIVQGNITSPASPQAQLTALAYTSASVTFTGIYSAGGSAPYVMQSGSRIYLDGIVSSSSATFTAGQSYTIGSIPAAFAPSIVQVLTASTNTTAMAQVTVSTAGIISFSVSTTFTGTLALWLSGLNWRSSQY